MTTIPITGDTWGDEVERPRTFILDEAQKPFGALYPRADSVLDALLTALEGVSEAQARFKPGSGSSEDDYSIIEVLRHVVASTALMAERVRTLALGLEPPVANPPGSLGTTEDASLAQLSRMLRAAGDAYLATVKAVDGGERLDTTTPHRVFGEHNCRGWIVIHTMHLGDHAHQVAKIKAHPAFPKA
jgi:hypothetical protein